jgi:hypothetical protein
MLHARVKIHNLSKFSASLSEQLPDFKQVVFIDSKQFTINLLGHENQEQPCRFKIDFFPASLMHEYLRHHQPNVMTNRRPTLCRQHRQIQ